MLSCIYCKVNDFSQKNGTFMDTTTANISWLLILSNNSFSSKSCLKTGEEYKQLQFACISRKLDCYNYFRFTFHWMRDLLPCFTLSCTQLQHEPLAKSQENYYWSLKQASTRILKEESFAALWKGHVPAQLLSGAYGLVQVGLIQCLQYITRNSFFIDLFKNLHNYLQFVRLCWCIFIEFLCVYDYKKVFFQIINSDNFLRTSKGFAY